MTDLQRASFGKRIIATIFDGILAVIVAVALAFCLSAATGYDKYMDTVNDAKIRYAAEYGIKADITTQELGELSEEQLAQYNAANEALAKDPDVIYAYNMIISLTMVITSVPILISIIAVEFVVPLMFGNGQTLGKKIFGIALMHVDGIKVNNLQLFARAVLGKFAIELMIPLSIAFMIAFGMIGIVGIIIIAILLIAQIICLAVTKTNALLHDVLAGTVAVDMASQKIFNDREELLAYVKKHHAEQVEKSVY